MDVQETQQEMNQSLPLMAQATGPWKKYYVHLAGHTDGAHQGFLQLQKEMNHVEVSTPEESHYVLVFCPIVSQVTTDIGRALQSIPVGKPTILVVMHPTEDRKDAVDESRRLVDDPNVHLTVDVLIRAGKLHGRKVKRKAWEEVGLFIAQSYPSYVHRKKIIIALVVFFSMLSVAAAVTVILIEQLK